MGLKSPLSLSSSPVEFPRDLGHKLQECEHDVGNQFGLSIFDFTYCIGTG
jgi:hypothetical protein